MPGMISMPNVDPNHMELEPEPWAEPCYEANYTRAIQVSATEREWIIEVGHKLFSVRSGKRIPMESE
jgi:hypothetical protein